MARAAEQKPSPILDAMRQIREDAASYRGIWSWITTVDHKRIGIMYGVTALGFFLLGGIEALLIRLQLSTPNARVLDPDQYNRIFTMHGTTMIFLVVMPLSAAFFNLITPLMIGARDVAFPRLNAFSYWVFLAGGIFMNASFFTGGNILHGELGAPDAGWFGYAPLTLNRFSPGEGVDFWALGLQILGIASMASGFNFIVTILNMRAPGMTLFRMPLFVWMTLVTSFLIVFAMPVITVALFELLFDRLFDANFFNVAKGGTPLLWQHMFWLFGHPEVYILILPAMGIVSEVLPTFARKPLFGYPFVVLSGIAIAFMSWGVWAHHMFTTGLGAIANSAFGVSTILIAIPTGVKIFNWMGTLWGGAISLKTPLYFAIGFIAMFTIGGLTGVTHSIVPSDYQQQDTYYVVAHFHQVLFGGAIFGLFAGIYYWYPKFTGRMLYEGLGQVQFWLMFIGFNLTFQPMMILGLLGMPRRIYSYPQGQGWDAWNLVATVGAFLIATSVLIFIINVIATARRKERAEADPWDGRTLEWSLPSPVPAYNFAKIPTVHALDDFWHQKYAEDESGRPVPVAAGGSGEEEPEVDVHGIHMPSPSFFPLITALGLPIIATGLIYDPAIVAVGAAVLVVGIYGWALEPASE
ncbi:MAG TPA: cytochrome c oxidase subunit I [Dehalococcoidia bacterium]|nr:cytochrome c oxidase subunit I [Dehalococcoidia bacterium]